MEKKRNSYPDACEKFFKSISVASPFRLIRRISHHQQESISANTSSTASIPKHPAAQLLKTTKSTEATEVVPIKFENSSLQNVKAKQAAKPHAPVSVQFANGAPMGEAGSQIAPTKAVEINPKAEATEQEKAVTSKGKRMLSFQQKFKSKADNTPSAQASNGQSHGHQGAKTNVKLQPSQSPRAESNKVGANIEDKFTDYINRTKIATRTTSDVDGKTVGDGNNGKNSSAPAEDNRGDQFSDYVTLAKKKMLRTMTSFIGGRSDSRK